MGECMVSVLSGEGGKIVNQFLSFLLVLGSWDLRYYTLTDVAQAEENRGRSFH